jgi:transposase-like protein
VAEALPCPRRHCQVIGSVTSDGATKKPKSLYHGHRFPAEVISCSVRWYFRFQLSLRDIEELLFERGVTVTYVTIRCWRDKAAAKRFFKRVLRSSPVPRKIVTDHLAQNPSTTF